ncbi:MAG TPA: hypothetical protein VKQ34_04385 [Candidatus Saccharimonadales bacterium]|nr:hypothetical protein [Candidatus Saccharimonadales bacterium]
MNKVPKWARATVVTAVASVALANAACTKGSAEAEQFRFDAHGGRYPQIFVYVGPGESQSDMQDEGYYIDGDTAQAICQQLGRTVTRHADQGETPGHSDEWVKVLGTPADGTYGYQFATEAYGGVVGGHTLKSC